MENITGQIPEPGQIGIFDSGYGGLTILKGIRHTLPQYDYLYLGDNARAPYGTRSFDVVYDFTLQAVEELFGRGCHLVILGCNTASAKALRSIQQKVLPVKYPGRRVLGVIIPTVEVLGDVSKSRHVGIFATPGTVTSRSYTLEIAKRNPDMQVTELACPMFVPLVETGEAAHPGADYFVKKYMDTIMESDPLIDTIVLGCTHYPILLPKIRRYAPAGTRILCQGELVGESLADYMRRHPEMEARCTRGGTTEFLTTESADKFNSLAALFLDSPVHSERITL